MKYLTRILVSCAFLTLAACGGGGGDAASGASGGGQSPSEGQTTPYARVVGQVALLGGLDAGSIPIRAQLRGISHPKARDYVDAEGQFTLQISAAEQSRELVIDLEGEGQFASVVMPQQLALHMPAGEVSVGVETSMSARGPAQTFSLEETSIMRSPGGVQVSVPANAFVYADDGSEARGEAQLRITDIDVRGYRSRQQEGLAADDSSDAGVADFAPNLIGLPSGEGAEVSPIYTYGMADFYFSQHDRELELKDGVTATIQLPLPNARIPTRDVPIPVADASVGDVLPMWHYDTEAMLWREEGMSQIVSDGGSDTGFASRGEVSHFSTWNIDWAVAPKNIRVIINLVDNDGQTVSSDVAKVDSYFVRAQVPPQEGPGWHNETSWKNTAQMTPEKNTIAVLTNHQNREEWIRVYDSVTGWTTMDILVKNIYINGFELVEELQGNYRFYNYQGPDEVVFDLHYDYIR